MSFSNNQLQTDQLPRVENVAFKPLKSDYRLVSVIGSGIFWLFLFSAATFMLLVNPMDFNQTTSFIILLVIVILAVVRLILVYIAFSHKGFALRQRDVLYKRGMFWKTQTSIPFNRVQHCEVKQGPIERMFDLAQLIVYTAGGSTSDLRIPGLDPDEANSIKYFILNKSSSAIEEEE